MKKRFGLILSCVLTLSLLAGCGAQKSGEIQKEEINIETAEEPVFTGGVKSFTDDLGREVIIEAPFERLIVFYSAHVENLYTLGAGDKIIGVHNTATFPPQAAFLPTFDYNGDPESVIAADPDCVLMRPAIYNRVPDYAAALENAGIPVICLYPDEYAGFADYIGKLAMLTGTEEQAAIELEKFYGKIDEIAALTAAIDEEEKQRVFFESTETNYKTVTKDSMVGLGIGFAGGINVAEGAKAVSPTSSIAEFGEERLLELADEIDVYISQRGAMNAGGNEHSITIRPGFDTIKAIQDGKILLINEKMISSPTFRYYKGVTELARFMYPQLMNDISGYETLKTATREDLAVMLAKSANLRFYVPSSSKYYQEEHKGHTYGLFEDVAWDDVNFDYIEAAVIAGAIDYEKEGGKEYFNPDTPVTRYDLAKALFIIFEPESRENHREIKDIADCENENIVQIIVDNGIMELTDGEFIPDGELTCMEIVEILNQINQISQ